MLKKRIVGCLTIKDSLVVRSVGFKLYFPVGSPEIAARFLSQWGADEIILLDISATRRGDGPNHKLIERVSRNCFVPLTVGGGIRTVDDVQALLQSGADKVAINSAAFDKPNLIGDVAGVFGSQCVVATIDCLRLDKRAVVYRHVNQQATALHPKEHATRLVELGAGEILLNSVDRDGAGKGFDLDLIQDVCGAVTTPVICCGGAGRPEHFMEIFSKTRASAAAAGNFFHFYEHSLTITKSVLLQSEISIRHDTHATYHDAKTSSDGRLLRQPDSYLEDLLFLRADREEI